MPFRFQSKNAFLTYPNCNLKPIDLINDLIFSLCETSIRIVSYLAVTELHESGEKHVHVALIFAKRPNIKNERLFDVKGFHPNIQPMKGNPATHVRQYLTKDPIDLVEHNWPTTTRKLSDNETFSLLLQASTETEFWELASQHCPRDVVVNRERLEYFCSKHFKPPIIPFVSNYDTFVIPAVIQEWYNTYFQFPRPERPKSLCIIGPSRTGKTQWARSLGPHIYWNGYTNFGYDSFPNDTSSLSHIVIDDIPFDGIKRVFKSLVGCQMEFTATDKYVRKRTIKNWGKPAIICLNMDMAWSSTMDYHLQEWFQDNCVSLTIKSPLF